MVTMCIKDNNGNVIYEEHEDGYKEYNEYNSYGELKRSEQHYSNGIIEIEKFNVI